MSWYRNFEIDILRVGELHIQQNIDSIYPLAGTVLYTDGSGNTFWSTGGAGGGGTLTQESLTSTVDGLGNFYASTTTAGINAGDLFSTVTGLGSIGYISTAQLVSTVIGIGSGGTGGGITTAALESTVVGLGTANYISSSQLTSTVRGLSANAGGVGVSSLYGVVSSGLSTVALFTSNTSNYAKNILQDWSTPVSTVSLFTSNTSNYSKNILQDWSTPVSTVALFTSNTSNYAKGIAQDWSTPVSTVSLFTSNTSNYAKNILQDWSTPVSTVSLFTSNTSNYSKNILQDWSTPVSTVALFTSNTSNYSKNILQDWSTPIQSTVVGLGSIGYISTSQLTSSLMGLGSLNYISSSQLTSTTYGLQQYVSSLVGTPPGNTTGTVLYLNYDTTVSPYRALEINANTAITTDVSTSLTRKTTGISVSQFQSDFTLPPFIPPGIWDLNIFASSTDILNVFIYVSLYLRNGGSETLLSTSDLVQVTDTTMIQLTLSFNVPYTLLTVPNSTVLFLTTGRAVAWNGSLWVATGVGVSLTATSPDGVNWTAGRIFTTNANTVAFQNREKTFTISNTQWTGRTSQQTFRILG